MTRAYWINTFRSVSDPDRLQAYADLAGPAMRASGGRFLARGTAVHDGAVRDIRIVEAVEG
jgi:uncharacterized protein (DUF1330 family)